MRTILNSIIFFWKPDIEFTTSLSVNTCRNRLEELGATTFEERWFWSRSNIKRISFSLKGRGYSFFRQGPALSGELRESDDATKVTATFWPHRLYPIFTSLLVLIFYLVFYLKDYLWVFFIVIMLFVNLGVLHSYRSSWESLEGKLYKSLKSWKMGE